MTNDYDKCYLWDAIDLFLIGNLSVSFQRTFLSFSMSERDFLFVVEMSFSSKAGYYGVRKGKMDVMKCKCFVNCANKLHEDYWIGCSEPVVPCVLTRFRREECLQKIQINVIIISDVSKIFLHFTVPSRSIKGNFKSFS